MNELQIEYFLAVAENLSFTKTANESYVSQPAVSKQIALMEEELGVTLFDRGHKSTRLTDAGRIFSDYFRRQNMEFEHIKQFAQNIRSAGHLSFRIATGPSWTLADMLEPICENIRAEYPNAQIIIENTVFDELSEAIHENQVDVIICMEHSIRTTPSLKIRPFVNIPRIIAYSCTHRLASKRNLTPLDFKDEIFFYPATYEKRFMKNLIKGCMEPYGFMPKLQAVSNEQSMLSCVVNGFGVMMADTWLIASRTHILKSVKLDTYHETVIAWRKDNVNPILDIFLREIEAFREKE
jgi:DNA-binding transcriptional LysR family regulator